MANADSMNETIEQMFALVRQILKDERDKVVNAIKEDVKSSKQKALLRMQ
ncbi:MAG: hypothetical protein WAM88_00995 [Nitrososphaeraceae archaeon]